MTLVFLPQMEGLVLRRVVHRPYTPWIVILFVQRVGTTVTLTGDAQSAIPGT